MQNITATAAELAEIRENRLLTESEKAQVCTLFKNHFCGILAAYSFRQTSDGCTFLIDQEHFENRTAYRISYKRMLYMLNKLRDPKQSSNRFRFLSNIYSGMS